MTPAAGQQPVLIGDRKMKNKKKITKNISKTTKKKKYISKPYWTSIGGTYWITEEE